MVNRKRTPSAIRYEAYEYSKCTIHVLSLNLLPFVLEEEKEEYQQEEGKDQEEKE